MSAKKDFHDSDIPVSGVGTSGGSAAAGGDADDTDTVGTPRGKSSAADGGDKASAGTPGGNITGTKGGTFGGTRDVDEGATGLGVVDSEE
jgi:hypothetical protein